jgi:hypothetical protein
MDTLFHDRISTIEAKLDDMKEEVQMAVSEVIEGEKVPAGSLTSQLRAFSLAWVTLYALSLDTLHTISRPLLFLFFSSLSSLHPSDMAKMSDLDDLATILETKAASEEVKHLAQQQSHLAISINGVAEAVSGIKALVAAGGGGVGGAGGGAGHGAGGIGENPVLFSVMGSSLGGSLKKGTGLLPRLDATHASSAGPSGFPASDHRAK